MADAVYGEEKRNQELTNDPRILKCLKEIHEFDVRIHEAAQPPLLNFSIRKLN